MKRLRITVLLLALVMSVGLFAACTEKSASFGDLLNANYTASQTTVQSMREVTELAGYSIYSASLYYGTVDFVNQEIALFQKEDTTAGTVSYKLFSFRSGTVVKEFIQNDTFTYFFEMLPASAYSSSLAQNIPMLMVEINDSETQKTTYELYDGTGKAFATGSGSISNNPSLVSDWIVFEGSVYTVEEHTGAISKKCELPANLNVLSSYLYKNDSYFYVSANDRLTVYDHSFNVVAIWTGPADLDSCEFYPLNDSNVLVQYVKEVNPEAKVYDLYEQSYYQTHKYDLVTEIFSIGEKTSTEVKKFDYLITELSTCYELSRETEENYLSGFENLVTLYPIVDKQVSYDDAYVEFYAMDNNGKLGKSYKLVEHQTSLPELVATNIFKVRTLYGYALVNANGTLLSQITNLPTQVGDSFVNEIGIYDLNFQSIYHFKENHAKLLASMDHTILVTQYAEEGETDRYTVYAFRHGEKTEITSYDAKNADSKRLIGTHASGIYVLKSDNATDYEYYNEDGTLLLKSQEWIDLSSRWSSSNDASALVHGTRNGETVYYFLPNVVSVQHAG